MKRNRLSPFLLAGITMLAGCSTPSLYALSIEDDSRSIDNVEIPDASLHDILRVGNPNVERVPGTNQLKITITIRNIVDEPIQILAQTSFLNRQKQPIGDDTNRQVNLIAAFDTITYTVISKQAEAADWVLRLGWNH
ncbi:MAG TPA: hypothetical protein VFZ65_16930 [Planctomycetota bacterium]|nr:hypothetical protein [Planctomycetota bacterium]